MPSMCSIVVLCLDNACPLLPMHLQGKHQLCPHRPLPRPTPMGLLFLCMEVRYPQSFAHRAVTSCCCSGGYFAEGQDTEHGSNRDFEVFFSHTKIGDSHQESILLSLDKQYHAVVCQHKISSCGSVQISSEMSVCLCPSEDTSGHCACRWLCEHISYRNTDEWRVISQSRPLCSQACP